MTCNYVEDIMIYKSEDVYKKQEYFIHNQSLRLQLRNIKNIIGFTIPLTGNYWYNRGEGKPDVSPVPSLGKFALVRQGI